MHRDGIVSWTTAGIPFSYLGAGRGWMAPRSGARFILSRQIGLRGPSDSHGPRLHDFRHRFAVETLVQWYRSGQDVERRLPVLSTYLGHVHVADTYWYLSALPRVDGLGRQTVRGLLGEAIMKSSGTLAALLESFFTQRLMSQRQASPHTISSYRDTFRLLLQFAQQRLHKPPPSWL